MVAVCLERQIGENYEQLILLLSFRDAYGCVDVKLHYFIRSKMTPEILAYINPKGTEYPTPMEKPVPKPPEKPELPTKPEEKK